MSPPSCQDCEKPQPSPPREWTGPCDILNDATCYAKIADYELSVHASRDWRLGYDPRLYGTVQSGHLIGYYYCKPGTYLLQGFNKSVISEF